MSKFDLLVDQEFTNSDTIVLQHNLNRRVFNVRVIVTDTAEEAESLRQIVEDIILDQSDPLNKLTVTLTSPRTGKIQLISEDTIQSPYYTVEEKLDSQIRTDLAGTAPIKFEYGGNANAGRVLEYVSGEASDTSPSIVISDGKIRGVTFLATATGSGEIGIYKIGTPDVLLYSFTISNSRKEVRTNLDIDIFQLDELYVKVISGPFNKPVVVVYTQTI